MRLFLRGLYTANGSVVANGSRITLKTASNQLAQDVLEMLELLGLRSYITVNKPTKIKWDNGEYISKESYDVNTVLGSKFAKLIGFEQKYKMDKINLVKGNNPGRDVKIINVEYLGEFEVFDYTVEVVEHTVSKRIFSI